MAGAASEASRSQRRFSAKVSPLHRAIRPEPLGHGEARSLGWLVSIRYSFRVRRIFQLGTILLLLTVFLAPLFEFFDRWDSPGLNNDTETSVFCLILLLSLLLAACTSIRHLVYQFSEDSVPLVWPDEVPTFHLEEAFTYKLIIPPISAPLLI